MEQTTGNLSTAAFLVDGLEVSFAENFRVYTSLSDISLDFAHTTTVYDVATKLFGGYFPVKSLYIVKYNTSGTSQSPVQALEGVLAMDNVPYYIICGYCDESTRRELAIFCEKMRLFHLKY